MFITESIAASLIQSALFAALRDDEIAFTLDGEILVAVGGVPFEPTVARLMRGAKRVQEGKVKGVNAERVEEAVYYGENASTAALGLLLAGMRRDRAAQEILANV
jgi:hypothetical protein